MPKPAKASSEKKSLKGPQWQQVLRDEKGRWIKGKRLSSTKEGTSTTSSSEVTHPKTTAPKKNSAPAPIPVEKSKEIEEEKVDCPRCGGNMKNKPIRCGLERVISVKICGLCNFWVPIS